MENLQHSELQQEVIQLLVDGMMLKFYEISWKREVLLYRISMLDGAVKIDTQKSTENVYSNLHVVHDNIWQKIHHHVQAVQQENIVDDERMNLMQALISE